MYPETILLIAVSGAISVAFYVKMWRMANNVRAIKNALTRDEKAERIFKAVNNPHIPTAELERILYDGLLGDLYDVFRYRKHDREHHFAKVQEGYKAYYAKRGLAYPKELEFEWSKDFEKMF